MSNVVPTSSALRALALEYKSLQEEPVEGFRVKLLGEDNLFEWEVAIFGPPDTLYQGGYFKAHMKFPPDYPYSPPSIRFLTKVWHPNVYEIYMQSDRDSTQNLAFYTAFPEPAGCSRCSTGAAEPAVAVVASPCRSELRSSTAVSIS
ncbi:Ubiquitin-conjugating enzyme E2 R2 [Eumeta japonica]|uniref:Ubiquitin-conjugating enzyme E2 R2 n=1 Tax=Eumeta variegata TaxID=151549 RepID=A0A4C1TKT7_EUMVA|nr:Ubiquitin-conjugating enzyme E2 R2 [Eumeta japonica]